MFLLPPKSLIKSMLGFGYIKHLVGSFILDKSYAFLPWMYLDMFCLFSELIDHVVYNRTLQCTSHTALPDDFSPVLKSYFKYYYLQEYELIIIPQSNLNICMGSQLSHSLCSSYLDSSWALLNMILALSLDILSNPDLCSNSRSSALYYVTFHRENQSIFLLSIQLLQFCTIIL